LKVAGTDAAMILRWVLVLLVVWLDLRSSELNEE